MVRERLPLARHYITTPRVPRDQRFALGDDRHARAGEAKFFADDPLRLGQELASDATRLQRWTHCKHTDVTRITGIVNTNARHHAAILFRNAHTRTRPAHDLRNFVFVGALAIK